MDGEKVCTRVKVLSDVRIEVLPAWIPTDVQSDMEKRGEYLERFADSLRGFLVDHRSQDAVNVVVRKVLVNACSLCRREWEEQYDEQGQRECANCGAKLIEAAKELPQ